MISHSPSRPSANRDTALRRRQCCRQAFAGVVCSLFLVVTAQAQRPIPEWPVAKVPTTVIGNNSATDGVVGITSAHLLPNGTLAVAATDPLSVLLYDSHGTLSKRVGQKGAGPGEFTGDVSLFGWPGDSVLTFTGGLAKWSLFSGTGRLVREWPRTSQDSPRELLLYRNAFAIRGVTMPFSCVRSVLDRIPQNGDPLREVVTDPYGRFWIRVGGEKTWTVYSIDGKPVARVILPAGTDILEIGKTSVVLKALDADDLERVEVWKLSMASTAPSAHDPCERVPDSLQHSVSGASKARLQTFFRNLLPQVKTFHGSNGRYPTSLGEMKAVAPTGVAVDVVVNTPNGWGLRISDIAAKVYCIGITGEGAVPGWPSGAVTCAPEYRQK